MSDQDQRAAFDLDALDACYADAQAIEDSPMDYLPIVNAYQALSAELRRLRAEHDELVAAREVIRTLKTPNDPQGANLKAALAAYDKVRDVIVLPGTL